MIVNPDCTKKNHQAIGLAILDEDWVILYDNNYIIYNKVSSSIHINNKLALNNPFHLLQKVHVKVRWCYHSIGVDGGH